MIANTEEIKNALQINDILGDFITLKKRGSTILLVAFSQRKNSQFHSQPARGSFKCFGCGKSGDAIEFLREHEAMSYSEALSYIAGHYNIPVKLTGQDPEYSETEKRRDGILAVLKWAKDHFKTNLGRTPWGMPQSAPVENQAFEYLQKRNLEKGSIYLKSVMPKAVMNFYAQLIKPGTAMKSCSGQD